MPNNHVLTKIDAGEMSRLIEENLSAKSLDFAHLPGGSAHSGNPAWFTSGINRAGYNGVVCASFEKEIIDQHIEATLEPFRQQKLSLTWWVGPLSAPANLGQAIQKQGFHHQRDMIGMAADLGELAEFVSPDIDYSFEPVLNQADLEQWMPPFLNAFGIPLEDKDLVLDIFAYLSFLPNSNWRHYLIRVNGEVVATSSLHLGGGVAGLYNIAALPKYRQHGLGSAITHLTFGEAKKQGFTLGTLQTTFPNALRLYHRMGFEVYCKFGVYQRIVW